MIWCLFPRSVIANLIPSNLWLEEGADRLYEIFARTRSKPVIYDQSEIIRRVLTTSIIGLVNGD